MVRRGSTVRVRQRASRTPCKLGLLLSAQTQRLGLRGYYGVVLMMAGAVMDAAEDVSPDLWRRYLRIALQGLRPKGAPLDPLPVDAVEPAQMEQLLIGASKRR